MKGEIDMDFYCSGNETIVTKRDGFICCQLPPECEKTGCGNYHRKHPTPEQFKEEFGEDYPDDWAVYGYNNGLGAWMIYDYFDAKRYSNIDPIVCVCTPFPKPDNTWRPEGGSTCK